MDLTNLIYIYSLFTSKIEGSKSLILLQVMEKQEFVLYLQFFMIVGIIIACFKLLNNILSYIADLEQK